MRISQICIFGFIVVLGISSCKKEPVKAEEERETPHVQWNPNYCKDLLGTYKMVSLCNFYDLTDSTNNPSIDDFNVTFTLDTGSSLNPDSFLLVSNSFIYFYAFDSLNPRLNLSMDQGYLTFNTGPVEGRLRYSATCDTLKGGYYFGYYDGFWDCDSVVAVKIH